MHYTTYTIIYTMHKAYYIDTTTITRNENARYHTEIHRLCASSVFVQVITRVGRIYCTFYNRNIMHTIIIQLYSAYRTLTLHKNIYFYKIHDLQG